MSGLAAQLIVQQSDRYKCTRVHKSAQEWQILTIPSKYHDKWAASQINALPVNGGCVSLIEHAGHWKKVTVLIATVSDDFCMTYVMMAEP